MSTTAEIAAQPAGPVGPRWLFQGPEDPTNVAPLFVEIVIDGGIDALTGTRRNRAESQEIFRQIFREFFATENIGQLVLGPLWLTATETQRERFLDALGIYLGNRVIDRVPNGQFFVRDAVLTGRSPLGAPSAEVITVFVGQNFSARVPWTVSIVDGELKVLDIRFAGNSFLLDQRNTFERVLRRNGNSLDDLIAEIQR